MESETVTLILNTYDISQVTSNAAFIYNQTVDNMVGTIKDNRCNLTWKNINMRQLLSTMYDKYERFNIYLYQINQTGTMTFSAKAIDPQYSMVDVRISGLPFLDNGYNVVSRNNISSAYLTSYLLNQFNYLNGGSTTYMYNPIILTFGKSTEIVNINIDMKNTLNQQYPTIFLNRALGQFLCVFKIIRGIPTREPNNIINGSRINLLQR